MKPTVWFTTTITTWWLVWSRVRWEAIISPVIIMVMVMTVMMGGSDIFCVIAIVRMNIYAAHPRQHQQGLDAAETLAEGCGQDHRPEAYQYPLAVKPRTSQKNSMASSIAEHRDAASACLFTPKRTGGRGIPESMRRWRDAQAGAVASVSAAPSSRFLSVDQNAALK